MSMRWNALSIASLVIAAMLGLMFLRLAMLAPDQIGTIVFAVASGMMIGTIVWMIIMLIGTAQANSR